jgi:hypothetical protein
MSGTCERDIPTLIIVDVATKLVLTYDGLQDVRDYGIDAVKQWKDLAKLASTLEM